MQLDTLSQIMNANYELNAKEIEITTLKLQNEQFQIDLKREKEFSKSFNKPNESIKYFEQLIKSLGSSRDTLGLGYISTEEGESSKAAKERNNKGKNSKCTCHYCGNKGHKTNVFKRKNANQNVKPKFMTHYHKCNKQGHQTHECRTRAMNVPKFKGHY